jgi:ankyrin repeat protein
MSGDLATVKLLLAHGANADAGGALSEAVTFGHADVAQTLIDAGADAQGVEGTGINLLHWAAITNRAALIPVLAKAGVPLNDQDDNGFTPLMYAATLDHNDTKTLEALLAAGADPSIKDFKNRTPMQQARRLWNTHIVRVITEEAKKPAR